MAGRQRQHDQQHGRRRNGDDEGEALQRLDPEQDHDQRQREPAHEGGPQVDPADAQQQVERLRHAIREAAPVARQVAQLPEDDEHRHPVQEAGHHRIGDEADQESEPEHAGQQLDRTHQQHQHDQCLGPLAGRKVHQHHAGRHRQRAGGGHVHEHRTPRAPWPAAR